MPESLPPRGRGGAENSLPLGVILAGGASSRFGGSDKGLLMVAGQMLVERVIARLAPQVSGIVIIANRNQAAYARLGLPVLADTDRSAEGQGFEGPFAGMRTSLGQIGSGSILTVPVDAARLPTDLALRLLAVGAPAQVKGVPVCALLSAAHWPSLTAAWEQGERSPRTWLASLGAASVDYGQQAGLCWSLNTPEELACFAAQERAREAGN